MLLKEDYFNDLELKDEDIIDDVEEPVYDLTVEEFHKLPEQYNYLIRFRIEIVDDDRDTTFIQTSLIPRIFKRLDTIFESYGIEDYKYVLASMYDVKISETVVKFGNYQLFCEEDKKYKFINGKYEYFFIHVFVNYPEFTYKRAFRFLYTMLNLYKNSKLISWMSFDLNTTYDYAIRLNFVDKNNHIRFYYYKKAYGYGAEIDLSYEQSEENMREFYYSVFHHFFGYDVDIDYDAIIKDVPFKPIRQLEF